MAGHGSRGSHAQLASGALFGLAALTPAVLSQSRPFVAVGGYALLTGVAALGLSADGSGSDSDADDPTAADATLGPVGVASAVVFPGLVVAWGLDLFEWEPWSSAVAPFVAVLYLTYAGFTVVIDRGG